MHDPLLFLAILALLAIASAFVTLCIIKRIKGDEGQPNEEARRQAEELREYTEQMNRDSANISARAKRLQQLLALQIRKSDKE